MAALAEYVGHPVPDSLAREMERVVAGAVFQRRIFFSFKILVS
jgi:hypothetical protein